jgi:hypothetical protein
MCPGAGAPLSILRGGFAGFHPAATLDIALLSSKRGIAGFFLPILTFLAIFHNASGGGVWRIAMASVCMPCGALIGLAKALKDWRAFAAQRVS